MKTFPANTLTAILRITAIFIACVAVVGLIVGVAWWREYNQPFGEVNRNGLQQRMTVEEFNPQTVIDEPFPAISKLIISTAVEGDEVLDDDELVLAVEIEGEARAWPINSLTGPTREIFNGQLAGRSIAATW